MAIRIYQVVFAVTLALFIFALVKPGYGFRLYDALTVRQEPTVSLQKIEPAPQTLAAHQVDDAGSEAADTAEENLSSEITTASIKLSDISFDLDSYDYTDDTEESSHVDESVSATGEISSSRNRLVIPRMGVDADVILSDTQDALGKGLWHIPGSALPGSPGNIVISAHRWLHKPPSEKTFYLIDELEDGDKIFYEYGNTRYTYIVSKHFVVEPDDVHILSQDENKLTLFTCTPLYSTTHRYVVNAELSATEPI